MTGGRIDLTTKNSRDYWGLCPECMGTPVFIGLGRDHWAICEPCRTKWWIGADTFSIPGWNKETEEDRAQAVEKLAKYRNVEPAYLPEPQKTDHDDTFR